LGEKGGPTREFRYGEKGGETGVPDLNMTQKKRAPRPGVGKKVTGATPLALRNEVGRRGSTFEKKSKPEDDQHDLDKEALNTSREKRNKTDNTSRGRKKDRNNIKSAEKKVSVITWKNSEGLCWQREGKGG